MSLRQVYTEIEINGSPEQVWRALMDFQSFKEWNPLFKFIEGDLRIGGGLTEHILLFEKLPVKWTSKVIILDPPHEFAWRGHVWFRAFGLGEHHFQIIPVGEKRVRFVHWELFFGLVPALLGFILRPSARRMFHKMNLAIKQRVEAGF